MDAMTKRNGRPGRLTPEILIYGFTGAADPRVSPDGNRILFAVTRTEKESGKSRSHLWTCAVDGSDARPLTRGAGSDSSGRWSPDGRWIAFVSDRVKKNGVFLLPTDGGEARELTRHLPAIGGLAWSPDGTHLAYTALYDPENPDERAPGEDDPPRVRVTRRIDYKQDNRGYLADARLQLFVLDVASGERRMVTREAVDHTDPAWSPDSRSIAVKIPNRNGICSQLGLVDLAAGHTSLLGPADGSVAQWAWSPDGRSLLFAGDVSQTWQSDFFLHDLQSGSTRRLTTDLASLPDAGFPTISPPAQPVWLDNRRVLFHAFRAGGSQLNILDTETGTVETIAAWQALNAGLSVDQDRRFAVQGHASLDQTGEIVVTTIGGGEVRVVTSYSVPTLEATPAARWERFDVPRPPYTIEAWLLLPPDFDPAKRYPLVLDVHGGPNGYYGHGFNATQQALAGAGFAVVFANPRGSSSYGREFTQQVIGDWGGEDFLDLMAVVDAALERPYLDPARTGIFGYSYGGFMTSWTIGQTDRFAAAVCGAPCFDLESFWGTSDIGHVFGRLQFGGAPHETPDWYAAHSPSNFIHRAKTPTLVIHGEADERCPIGQGEQLFMALLGAGVETEFVRYPGGSHLFLRRGPAAHRLDFLTRVVGWFRDHLGGPV
jgi:dipeptidyl aminopeptidase/acylaminoacyl peptidase